MGIVGAVISFWAYVINVYEIDEISTSRKINITTLYYSILLRFHPYVYIHCRSSVISCLLLSSQTSQKFAIFVFITHSILNIKEQYEVILINGIVYDIICEF